MKSILLVMTLVLSTSAFASSYTECTPEQFQILAKSEGPKKNLVDDLIYLETAAFSCEVKTEHFFFPADCNRFTFSTLTYKIKVGAKKLTAKVNDGRISCTPTKRTVLVDAEVSSK